MDEHAAAADRVADYLDDQLQTARDVATASLDALLARITGQQQLLKQQLAAAHRALAAAQQSAHARGAQLQHDAAAFHARQADVDRRLLVIAASDTSADAVPRFETALLRLDRLHVARRYVQLLRAAEALSSQAHALLPTCSDAALQPYTHLRALHTRLASLQADAEGAAPHLLHHVDGIAQSLRTKMLGAFSSDLARVLGKIHWPTPQAHLPSQLRDEWHAATTKLLQLQMPELQDMSYATAPAHKIKLPPVLFPLQVLVQPLEARFRYHFEGDRPTNRIDRPEFFLSHITTLLHDYSAFVTDHVQPVLLSQFRGTHLALNPVYIDAMSAFVTALLPMLRSKIRSLLPKLAGQPQLLSHLMHQVMTFDSTIRDDWGYDGGHGVDGWKGLSWEFLVQDDWFGRWLQVEKDFALARYQSIVEASDFGDLDYESVDSKATKPTKGAIRVNDLLETITDRYRPLTSFSQKLTFLIDIQIAIFDKYHEKLQSNLEAYLTMTTALGRAMGGVTKEEQERLLGVEGLERLCKTYGSADYLEKAMRDWSDDVFFLDIWEGLQDRARQENSIGGKSVADVAERTSKSIGEDGDGGALFDETASWYARLRDRSEKIIVDTLNSNVRQALRPYHQINPWATLSGPAASAPANLSPTAEIDPLLTHLGTTLGFLSRALASAPLRRITRAVLASVSSTVWDNVLTRYRFSTAGAAQLQADLAAICRVVNKQVGPGVAETGLRRCLEGAQLVGLPVKGGKDQAASDEGTIMGDEDWAAWGVTDNSAPPPQQEQDNGTTSDTVSLGLWEVEKRLFADNQAATDVLDELGLEMLTYLEARKLLRHRVELAG
ncbi:TIP-1 family-domain-containing protein [Ampelomyces quisqualis]|uniref:TIP-1 family-domain-containing protein n=1 Tax=Ampelomyces quisqualis TaxID=50730 RepID=A0A6A5R077_AMPQU|nr:TIP-1 family-domain-containing protein [Ampelomyces quisqualis]